MLVLELGEYVHPGGGDDACEMREPRLDSIREVGYEEGEDEGEDFVVGDEDEGDFGEDEGEFGEGEGDVGEEVEDEGDEEEEEVEDEGEEEVLVLVVRG
ncbi:hypothetical protein LENED_007670 [Lentinula edodes]|uniref:Uncharacterized protein n=1 Tax=Lentinula edodes TaxID=5353 RepID=A0A1Q3EF04_LENED|nr:hypothetical protein LENED_007670 [Lentinula edodes]